MLCKYQLRLKSGRKKDRRKRLDLEALRDEKRKAQYRSALEEATHEIDPEVVHEHAEHQKGSGGDYSSDQEAKQAVDIAGNATM